jgi:hypothetical protein
MDETLEECPICYEKIQKYGFCITKCNHQFCMDCMMNHIQNNQSCPLCRQEVLPEKPKPDPTVEYETGFEDGLVTMEEEMRDIITDNFHLGYQAGTDSAGSFAQEWRSKYNALNKIYTTTVDTLQKTHTLSVRSNPKLKRSLSE